MACVVKIALEVVQMVSIEGAELDFQKITLKKNESKRVTAICSGGCKWRIHASYNNNGTFHVKTYNDKYTCSINNKNKRISSKWLAEHNQFFIIPHITLVELQKMVRVELGYTVSIDMCRSARRKVLRFLYEYVKIDYARSWDFKAEIEDKNDGSIVELLVDDEGPNGVQKFLRLYACFVALKNGFFAGCRRIIGVDSCFLKGIVRGELLVAVGRDANNQIFPIAWAQVEVESAETWRWFLELLKKDLQIEYDKETWVFSSDQQKVVL
ncbi:uncharacterized protein [Rutidosis leptorrhynchoides]|uniref:uncharacterized protein n=1 Tax=Rutidosis leptorrhynchoides TaxID=125765 RepID=UPI003A9A00CA